jgi:sodium-dependent dicarboxylate transporter 2/3/5
MKPTLTHKIRQLAFPIGLVLALFAAWIASSLGPGAAATAAVTTLCAIWWIAEPIAIPATSLIPFAALPLFGVLSEEEVAQAYGHPLILLLMGGFLLSQAMESSGAHQRLAFGVIRHVGGSGPRLLAGFMLATALVSAWISNTATVLMMMPVALAVADKSHPSLRAPLVLGLAWAASIGGLATPLGTPPNLIFMAAWREHTGQDFGFLDWVKVGAPATVVLLPIAWLLLRRHIMASATVGNIPRLPPTSPAERRVLGVFLVTAALWAFRTEPFGGWTGQLSLSKVGESTIALAACVALFVVPDGKGQRLLSWERAEQIPWGILLLFGGGLSIAKAFAKTGLSEAIGNWSSTQLNLQSAPYWLIVLSICLVVTFLTEVTSNTATATLLMPVLAATAQGAGIPPEILMIPAVISCSCAFMLPVATAPNAIAFGTGAVSSQFMAREGFYLNIAGSLALCLLYTALFT